MVLSHCENSGNVIFFVSRRYDTGSVVSLDETTY